MPQFENVNKKGTLIGAAHEVSKFESKEPKSALYPPPFRVYSSGIGLPLQMKKDKENSPKENVDMLREEFNEKVEKLVNSKDYQALDDVQKIKLRGEVAAKAARFEYFLMSFYDEKLENEMETSGSNKGEDITKYRIGSGTSSKNSANKASGAWCTVFVANLFRTAGMKMKGRQSGYKFSKDWKKPTDYDSSRGGMYVGKDGKNNEFKDLKNSLLSEAMSNNRKRVDSESSEEYLSNAQLAEEFLKTHQIQAGDMLVKVTGMSVYDSKGKEKEAENDFKSGYKEKDGKEEEDELKEQIKKETDEKKKKAIRKKIRALKVGSRSHTTIVEKVEGTKIYTIGGNESNGIRGRVLDLSNPNDVKEIIFVGRPSMANDVKETKKSKAGKKTKTSTVENPAAVQANTTKLDERIKKAHDLLGILALRLSLVKLDETIKKAHDLLGDKVELDQTKHGINMPIVNYAQGGKKDT